MKREFMTFPKISFLYQRRYCIHSCKKHHVNFTNLSWEQLWARGLNASFTTGHHEHVMGQMQDDTQLILRLVLQVRVCSCCHQAWGTKCGAFFPWMWAISEWDQPLLRPSRTGVVHPVVTESACERNYSSFAPLGVRRRDPAYRSDSWTGWMVVLRDDPPSEDKRDRCITTAQPRSVCACLISGAVLKMYIEINIKLLDNSYYWADNRVSKCCMMMWLWPRITIIDIF